MRVPANELAFAAVFCVSVLMLSCAGPRVDSKKAPGADLWDYHAYSWADPKGGPGGNHESEIVKRARDRTDVELTDRGMIPVSPEGNPDVWISEEASSDSLALQFRDARTGEIVWSGRATVRDDGVDSQVERLVSEYFDAYRWHTDKFWWTGI